VLYTSPVSKPAGTSPRDVSRGLILAAARERFRRNGIRVTTMDVIAKAAGVSRQTVYKNFATRLDLINAAIAERISELADEIDRRFERASLVDAFVRRVAEIVDAIGTDAELATLIGEDSPVTLHQALWQPAVHDRGLREWQAWLRQARKEGLLRSDVTDADIYEWLQTVLTSLILRPDHDPEHRRTLIEVFLVDSLGLRGHG
jgi:AcrR family transcriptional regulator